MDNMEAALLPDEHTDFVSTNWLGIPETGQSASHLPNWLQDDCDLGVVFDNVVCDLCCHTLIDSANY